MKMYGGGGYNFLILIFILDTLLSNRNRIRKTTFFNSYIFNFLNKKYKNYVALHLLPFGNCSEMEYGELDSDKIERWLQKSR